MMYKKRLTVISLVSLMACLAGQACLGMGTKITSPLPSFQEFKLIPRIDFWGFSGDYTRAEGQAMVPIWGDVGHAFYFLAEGNKVVNDSDWLGGAGLGYRQVYNERIFGAYLISGYQNSSENNGFYIANPGLEMLSETWDIDLNGYLPFKQKKSFETQEAIASEDLGITHFVRFTGHSESDHIMRVFSGGAHGKKFGEESGEGFDGEIGRVIPHIEDLRIYVGGYHFDFDDSDSVNGFEARAVYELNRYLALEGEYNYDNAKHSQAVLGLRFTLGGYSAEEKKRYGIAARLLYPIEHDLATSSSSATVVTILRNTVDLGEKPIHDNIWFYKPSTQAASIKDTGPQQGDGTFENPYIGFTQAGVNVIPETSGSPNPVDKHPLLFFAPGNYSLNGFSVTHDDGLGGQILINDRFNLKYGWGMYGRSSTDYTAPAMGDTRALFIGGLDTNHTTGPNGIDPTTLNSVRINLTTTTSAPQGFLDHNYPGLYAANAKNVVLQNSDITNTVTDIDAATAQGIYTNASTITFKKLNEATDGTTNIISKSTTTGLLSRSADIWMENGSILNFESGQNNVQATSIGVNSAGCYGLFPLDSSIINFIGGTNTITVFARSENGGVNGVQSAGSYSRVGPYANNAVVFNFLGGNNTINSTLEVGPDINNGISAGIYSEINETINFSGGNNIFNCKTIGGFALGNYGILNLSVIEKIQLVTFNGGITHFNFTQSGVITGVYGISINNVSDILVKGESIISDGTADFSLIAPYVDFTLTPDTLPTTGTKIDFFDSTTEEHWLSW